MDLIIDNIEQAIVDTKKQLRTNLPELKGIFQDLKNYIETEVSLIEDLVRDGKAVIPEVNYEPSKTSKWMKQLLQLLKTVAVQ